MAKNIFQKIYYKKLEKLSSRFTGLILNDSVNEIPDLIGYFDSLHQKVANDTRILITYHNHLWEPVLNLASKLGLRKKVGVQNWLDEKDITNILNICGFNIISTQSHLFGLIMAIVAKPYIYQSQSYIQNYSVSIIIPARNEAGNIPGLVPSIPQFGKYQEIIFVEGNSTDKTWNAISNLKSKNINKNSKLKSIPFKRIVKAYKQKGKGKADAVWLGFEKAKGDILIIYDADCTVDSHDLPKFYKILATGLGEFANGSRMIYPMEKQSMRFLNQIGNKLFGYLFTKILGQNFKDTLCGTKALFKKDYLHMRKFNKTYFKYDPFGDFALIFGAIKNNLKVMEVPVRYKERVYGTTNISRFKHGLILFKMTLKAFIEFKFY